MNCGDWWNHHVHETYRYVLGARDGNRPLRADAARKLLAGASDWGILLGLPAAGVLMGDHVRQVARLADAAFKGDDGSVERAAGLLGANADDQARLYGSTVPGFRMDDFSGLMAGHIRDTGAYVGALATKDYRGFRERFNAVLANRVLMAGFWRLACGPAGRLSPARGVPARSR